MCSTRPPVRGAWPSVGNGCADALNGSRGRNAKADQDGHRCPRSAAQRAGQCGARRCLGAIAPSARSTRLATRADAAAQAGVRVVRRCGRLDCHGAEAGARRHPGRARPGAAGVQRHRAFAIRPGAAVRWRRAAGGLRRRANPRGRRGTRRPCRPGHPGGGEGSREPHP